MRLRGAEVGGIRVRRRAPGVGERLAEALGGGAAREVAFDPVDGVWQRAGEPRGDLPLAERPDSAESARPPRPAVHVYTAGGRTLGLFGALVGRHVDLFA